MAVTQQDAATVTAQNEARRLLGEQLDKKHDEYRNYALWWSFVYHFLLVGAAACSLAAALILKLEALKSRYKYPDDLAAALAAFAAFGIIFVVGGSFGRKWRTYLVCRNKIARLKLDLNAANADVEGIQQSLNDVIQRGNEAILGPE
ncbi:MAG TPA: hypothetical protein VF666_15010 [Pyrinomonadaceae bacterium]|jgi:hypothetical protein